MTPKKPRAPIKLDQAWERLNKAVSGLESALENGAGSSGDLGGDMGGNQAKDLAAAREENAVLKKLNQTIGQRLDTAIERLQGAIGES